MKRFSIAAMVFTLIAMSVTFSGSANAASKEKIDRRVNEALAEFRSEIGGANAVLAKAKGVLVFPLIRKAGIGIGGEYGEGSLRIGGQTVSYYSTASSSELWLSPFSLFAGTWVAAAI